MEENLIDGYPLYPIYSFSFRWSQDGEHNPDYPNWQKDLPAGRVWNATGFDKMYKEEKTQEEIDRIAKDWWEAYILTNSEKVKNPELTKIEAKFKERNTWLLTWFQHETFDTGLSDTDVLNSFEQYVRRKESIHKTDGLMGADDRWRWHGSEPSSEPNSHSPAPCRCKFCKEQGMVRIAH